MTEFFIIYDPETGEELCRGSGPKGAAAAQERAQSVKAAIVPFAAIRTATTNIDAVKAHFQARVDEDAEAARGAYITPGAGQALTYLRKEAEAIAYLADTGANVPFLAAEAAALGITVADLATAVAAAAADWIEAGAEIEAKRRAAKIAISEAQTVGAIAGAAAVNW